MRKTGVKPDTSASQKRNCIEPHCVNSLVLVSKILRNFGGVKYENKAPVQKIFLQMYLEKCRQSQKKAYNDASNNVLESSEESSRDQETVLPAVLQPPLPQTPDPIVESNTDSEEESQDLLGGVTRLRR